MKKYLLIIAFLLNYSNANAYELRTVYSKVITVNSITAIGGNTRSAVNIDLPTGTVNFIYRLSVARSGNLSSQEPLIKSLSRTSPAILISKENFQEYAGNTDGSIVDFFYFTHYTDAINFRKKNDNWTPCESFTNTTSRIVKNNKLCYNTNVWFGFRNNNTSQGINIFVEVVAIIDKNDIEEKFNFCFYNTLDYQMDVYVSADGNDYQPYTISKNGFYTLFHRSDKMFVKVKTKDRGERIYNVYSFYRYYISYNQETGLFELFKYS